MSSIPESPFDGGRDWLDVQTSVAYHLRKKFAPLNIEDVLEDVLSEVTCDLMGYWSKLASSQKEGQLSFAFAVRRGTWMGVHKVSRVFAHNDRVQTYDPSVTHRIGSLRGGWDTIDNLGYEDDARYDLGGVGEFFDFVDPRPGPEDIACADDDLARARQMLQEMSTEEVQEYFAELTGESLDAEAERTGVSRRTVSRHRQARKLQLKDRAAKYGLTAVAE